MQENFFAPKQSQASNSGDGCRLVDGVEHGLARHISATGSDIKATADMADGNAAILFLDDLRLTRDCMTEIIQDLCPEFIILGLRPSDYPPETLADVALIIFNLHGVTISEAVGFLRLEVDVPAPPVLFITNRDQSSETMEAVECGAMGLVRANARIELLIAAIRLVIAGGSYFPAETITSLMAQTPASKNHP